MRSNRQFYEKHLDLAPETQLSGAEIDAERGEVRKDGKVIAAIVDGQARVGFNTPSKRQELFSKTTVEWGWPEYAIPTYVKSHIHPENLGDNEIVLVPTFRLPTLIHTRSGNAKWLAEISNRNPLWMHTSDGERWGIKTGDLVRDLDRHRPFRKSGVGDRRNASRRCRVFTSHRPLAARSGREKQPLVYKSGDDRRRSNRANGKCASSKESARTKATTPTRPEFSGPTAAFIKISLFPFIRTRYSGMHCWHQKVRVEKAHPEDKYGDVLVDTEKSFAIYKEWLAMARPAPGPNGLRRPLWLARPLRPAEEMFYLRESK